MSTVKKALLIVVVLFVGFYLLREPADLARFAENVVVGLYQIISTLFEALIEFFDTLQS